MASWSNPYFQLLFLIIAFRYYPEENDLSQQSLKTICMYETRALCPECFRNVEKCTEVDELFVLHDDSWFNKINGLFNAHTSRIGTFRKENSSAILKQLNRDNIVEKLLLQFCQSNGQVQECKWTQNGSAEQAKEFIINSILDNTRVEGCIFCPTGSRRSLQRFLSLLGPSMSELLSLLAIRINVEPLLLMVFSNQEPQFPVPKLLDTFGFSFLESHDGESLEYFYEHPLPIRMLIASELIKAAFRFTDGAHGLRIYLTDINPDNIVVKLAKDSMKATVSIVDLDNVIILDSWADSFPAEHKYHTHSRIDCQGCFAYVQEDVCRYQSSDLNLFAVCQLLLENINGNYASGLLHKDRSKDMAQPSPEIDDPAETLHHLLQECIFCQPPACRNRSIILSDVLNTIDRVLGR